VIVVVFYVINSFFYVMDTTFYVIKSFKSTLATCMNLLLPNICQNPVVFHVTGFFNFIATLFLPNLLNDSSPSKILLFIRSDNPAKEDAA
jgi:hypothetical protein